MNESGRGKRIAILIGTNEYSKMDKLEFAESDARDMGKVLLDPNICGFDEVIELINKNKEEVSKAIEKVFKNAKKEDQVLIYYSGHGKPSYKFDLCLLFKETDPDSLLATSLKFDYIKECKDQSSCNRVVVILDCCYSGTAGMKGDYLQEMLSTFSGSGTIILTSTGQTGSNIAKEDKELKHGVFTHYLLKGLKDWAADYDNDGIITVNDLYRYTFTETKAKGLQHPQMKGSYEGEMVLGRNLQKIEEREFEQKKEKLIQHLSSAPSFVIHRSFIILQKMYNNPSALEPTDLKIKPHLESLLNDEIQAETYVEVVKYQEKLRKQQEEEQKQKERLERERKEKEEQERLRKQRDEELQRQKEEEERQKEKEFQERQKKEEEERKRKEKAAREREELEKRRIEEEEFLLRQQKGEEEIKNKEKEEEEKPITEKEEENNKAGKDQEDAPDEEIPPEKPGFPPWKNKTQKSLVLVGFVLALLIISAILLWPRDEPKIESFSANPEIVTSGENITLSWNVSNATHVTITPGVGDVELSGLTSVSPDENTTYILTATNEDGENATSVLTVYSFKEPEILYFEANPEVIVSGQNITLSWDVSNAANVTITPEIGDVPLNGSMIVKPHRATTYTLTATNRAGDNVTKDVTVRQQATTTYSGSEGGEDGDSGSPSGDI